MRQWGDTKYYLYYITEFGSLKRKRDEVVGDFSKRFNKMYSRIPAEIKTSETSAKLTYAKSFDHGFSLLLRERKSVSILNMQYVALEVESNILASNKLKEETDYQMVDKKGKKEIIPSNSIGRALDSKMNEMNKIIKNSSVEIDRLELGNKKPEKTYTWRRNKSKSIRKTFCSYIFAERKKKQ